MYQPQLPLLLRLLLRQEGDFMSAANNYQIVRAMEKRNMRRRGEFVPQPQIGRQSGVRLKVHLNHPLHSLFTSKKQHLTSIVNQFYI